MSKYFINKPNNKIPAGLTTEILKESKALDYHCSLAAYKPTPLVCLNNLASKYGVANIYLKNEAFRFGLNAFKGLGASYAIHEIIKQHKNITTFCTATDGNHGRAVAWASRLAGKQSVVFVPKHTVQNRIDAIEREGAKVIVTDENYDEACELAERTCKIEGWQLVQDTSWEGYEEVPAQIMAGYTTMFQELEDTLHLLPKPKIDIVFLQVGVGSWAGSAIWYYLNRYGKNSPKIVVEPDDADVIFESFKAGKRVPSKGNFQTIMAGLNCGVSSLNAWDVIKNGADASIKIEDKYAEQAMRELYYPIGDDISVVAGESGVGGLAGFIAIMTQENMKKLRDELNISESSNILFYNTEGATDLNSFSRIVSAASQLNS